MLTEDRDAVPSSRRSLILIVSVVVALVTLAAGLTAIALRSTDFESTAEILIAPVGESVEITASSSDTLSRGTIVSTFAQAFGSSGTTSQALAEAGIEPAERDRVSATSRVISGTSIIEITAQADTRSLAVRAAAAISGHTPELAGYSTAFRPLVLEPASDAEAAGPSGAALVAGSLLLAILAGCLTGWALSRELRRRAGPHPFAEPTPNPDEERTYEASARAR